MKKAFKVIAILTLIGIALYALYLCYVKFIRDSDDDDWDELEDWGYEFEDEETPISFTDRVKAAAERQLNKAR